MNYYHVYGDPPVFISGPHAASSDYVRKLTRCGTPEALDLSAFDLVPEVREPLGPDQTHGEPVVSEAAVTIPARDKTPEELATDLAASRAALRCTPRQARLALAGAGLLTAVEEFVATGDAALQIEWEYASEVKRDWPPVLAFAEASEISEAQLDALFALAATL